MIHASTGAALYLFGLAAGLFAARMIYKHEIIVGTLTREGARLSAHMGSPDAASCPQHHLHALALNALQIRIVAAIARAEGVPSRIIQSAISDIEKTKNEKEKWQ